MNALTTDRWGLWAPFDYLPSMAAHEGFSPTLALYLISIIKYGSFLPLLPLLPFLIVPIAGAKYE